MMTSNLLKSGVSLLRDDAGELFVIGHVDNLEGFGVQRQIRPEGELAEVALLHLDQQFLVLGAQARQHAAMHYYPKLKVRLVARAFLEDFAELALVLDTHGERAQGTSSNLNSALPASVKRIPSRKGSGESRHWEFQDL